MMYQNTNGQSTSSSRRESPPEDLDKDWASLFGSEGESDTAQPVRPPKKQSTGQKPKNTSTSTKLDSVVIDESDESEEEDEYEVKAIKAHRTKRDRIEYKIRWKGYGPEADTWEPASHLVGAEQILKEYNSHHNIGSKHNSQSSSKRTRGGDEDRGSDSNSKRSATPKQKQKKHLNGRNGKEKHMSDGSSSQRSQSPSAEDVESVPQQEWHARYCKSASWDHLIKSVRTVQRDIRTYEQGSKRTVKKDLSDTLYVCLLWQSGKTTWVPNAVARVKLPQKMLEFYENETAMKISSKSRMSPDQL